LRLLKEAAADFRHPQAVLLSVGVEAKLVRVLTPLQHPELGTLPPSRKPTQGARLFDTMPHVIAASACGATTIMHTIITQANLKRAIECLELY